MTLAFRTGSMLKRSSIGLTLAFLAFIGGEGWALLNSHWWFFFSFPVMAFILFSCAAFQSWRRRQFTAKTDTGRILTDSKPHLLYLRCFRSDLSTTKIVFGSSEAGFFASQEEQLRDVLQPIGELVAIGRPGEEMPTPGAARRYASDEEWQEIVEREMLAVRLVIIRATVGENLLWEAKHALETLNPQKVLILVLNMNVMDYESFRTNVNPLLRESLPEGATLCRRFWRVSGFIAFASDWKPSFFPLRAPLFRCGIFKAYWSPFKFALRPVFESFGVEWQPPPVAVEMILLPMTAMLWILGSGLWMFFRAIVH